MKHKSSVVLGAAVLAAFTLRSGSALAADTLHGAPVMTHYDMIVDLNDLPRRYSCDDLWYKFRDVLRSIGARDIQEILPYECQKSLGPQARSPRVHVDFFLPAGPLTATNLTASDSKRNIVRLAAGHPASLEASDCALLQQIRDTLLASLPVQIVGGDLQCSRPSNINMAYSLEVRTALPVG